MTILRAQDNKIIRGLSGEVLSDSGTNPGLVLDLNTNLQIPNRIFKGAGTNLVSQITDSVSNVPFINGGNPVYSYEGHISFPTINDYLKTDKHYDIFDMDRFTNWSLNVWIYPTLANDGTIRYIIGNANDTGLNQRKFRITANGSNTLTFDYFSSGFYSAVLTGSLSDDLNTWVNILVVKQGTAVHYYYRGIYRGANSPVFTGGTENTTTMLLGAGTVNTIGLRMFTGGRIRKFEIYDSIYHAYNGYTQGQQAFTPVYKPITYYKRYKDDGFKKLYLSSKYLPPEGTDINAADEITSIVDEFGNVFTGSNCLLSKEGFVFNGSTSYLLKANTSWLSGIGSGDFFMGLWIKPESMTGGYWMYADPKIYIYMMGTSLLGQVGGQEISFFTSVQIGRFLHAALVKKDNIVYAFLNGILVATNTNSVDISQTATDFWIGGDGSTAPTGTVADPLFSRGTIIDPTGKAVGEKVFDPPRRGGFDGEITQF